MSEYLIHELKRYGVAVRDRRNIATLRGEEGRLAAVTLTSGEQLPFSCSSSSGASMHEWLEDTLARDRDGFILTRRRRGHGEPARDGHPFLFAAGDVRSGSTKRCATAVGEGSNGRPVRPRPSLPGPSRRANAVSNAVCTHLDQIAVREPAASVDACEDCLRIGGWWFHLRLCLACGHIGCCDSSPNRHATAHARSSQHPIIRSLEPGEDWCWCYEDEITFRSRPRESGLMSELPELALEPWEPTKETLHLWAQIVGKVRLATTPPQNHWWNAPLYLDTRGWTTRRLRSENLDFDVSFDFVAHELVVRTSTGEVDSFALADGLSVAAFHERFFELLAGFGIDVGIKAEPYRIPITTPFAEDTEHASYDREAVERLWQALRWIDWTLQEFAGLVQRQDESRAPLLARPRPGRHPLQRNTRTGDAEG